jgi:hypothetical protein
MKTKRLKAVKSLMDLRHRAGTEPAYVNLAIAAARNLGGSNITNLQAAMNWLNTNASETDEEGVVAEVNFCR